MQSDLIFFTLIYVTYTVFLSSADYANILILENDILRSRNSRGGLRCFLNLGFPEAKRTVCPHSRQWCINKGQELGKTICSQIPDREFNKFWCREKRMFWRSRHQDWEFRKFKYVFITWVSYQNCIQERTARTTIITEKPTVGKWAMNIPGLYINRIFMTMCTSAHHYALQFTALQLIPNNHLNSWNHSSIRDDSGALGSYAVSTGG